MTVEEELQSKEAFVKRLDGTFEKYESIVLMREDLFKLQECVDKMLNSGLEYEAILILLHHHTKIPKGTIKKVLAGLHEMPHKYFRNEE